LIAHNAIIAHATAVDIYRTKYLPVQEGTIGIVLNTAHFYPNDPNSADDIAAAQRGYGTHFYYASSFVTLYFILFLPDY
jgi:beta-glucosidase